MIGSLIKKSRMRTNFNSYLSLKSHLLILIFFIAVFQVGAQGRFVRGVEKTEYSLTGIAADFYVSPLGNDNWSGKLDEPNINKTDGPFATLERAKNAVGKLKQEVYKVKKKAVDKRFMGTPHQYGTGRDILVLIRQGTYSLDNPLGFSPEDGGERVETDLPTGAFEYHELKDCFVTYAAYPGETPVISGGEQISGWNHGKDGIWSANINRKDIKDLYANGKRLTLARTPNTGYYYPDGQPTDSLSFKFKAGDLKSWKDMEMNKIHIKVRWGAIQNSISWIDAKKRIAWLKSPSPEIMVIPPRYYVENVKALIDTINEWYLNVKNHTISFIPEPQLGDPNKATIVFPKLENLIAVSGSREKPVRNLRFYNLKFENTQAGGKGTITFQYAKNCELLKNTVENVSQSAVHFGIGCYHNLISKNTINNVIGSGIVVAGNPKPENWNDLVSDNIISRNRITNMLIAGTGISTYNALRSTVSHNYVSHIASYGITLGSWPNIEETSDGSHLAEYNNVSFTNMIWDDQGGIAVYGLSPGSVVRNNVIHDVHPAATNENVALFFQNMSSGWTVTDNTYYNLKQGQMKLCACYLVDNVYENNQLIESPAIPTEEIIDVSVDLSCRDLDIKTAGQLVTGTEVLISALVANAGSTGMADVLLYVDGKVVSSAKLRFISKNERRIEFKYKFFDPGKHTIAIGNTSEKEVTVAGEPLFVIYRDLKTPVKELPQGDSLLVTIKVQNIRTEKSTQKVELMVDGKISAVRDIQFMGNETKQIEFSLLAEVGSHVVTIAGQPPLKVHVYPVKTIDIQNAPFQTYCTATAKPCAFNFTVTKNHYEITAAGTDFLHAEDSYGTIYLKGAIEGNFVATVKVIGFSEGISEWFRAGIFVRNDLSKNSSSKSNSLGSFLLFSTTKRCGAQWDEFGDGCMHNTKSRNYGVDKPLPVWLKLVRHGNSFTGYYSFDNRNWVISRESGDIPGLAKKMDIGLAGGANDQKVSTVTFEDFQLEVEKE